MQDVVKAYRKIVYLTFPPDASRRPHISNLTRMFDLSFNILKAKISPRQEGYMTVEISGSREAYDKGVEYLKEQGISLTPVAQRISRDEDSCTECGLCTALCPSGALYLDRASRRVCFDTEKCTACAMCTRVCPVNAMNVQLEDNGW
jgi:L-aspartate semialdehyde sulfurtransferase ferredoxin